MNFDKQPVRANSHSGASERNDHVSPTGSVTRIDKHRQVRFLFRDSDCG